jgi:Ca-activated chloride channel homolog
MEGKISRMIKLMIVATAVFISTVCWARDLGLIYENNQAVKTFKKEKKVEAFEQFLGLTAKSPDDVHLKFNIASSLQSLAQEEKAIKLYHNILLDLDKLIAMEKTEDEMRELYMLKFAVLYNLGVAHQVMQKQEEALENYQKALALDPESKEIKTNIELMMSAGQGKGKGKGKSKEKDSQSGEGEGEGDPEDSEDQKDKDQQQKEKQQQEQKPGQQKKGFDQKYMSMDDLKRIMEELKDQEQNIRAKMDRKGVKSAPKDKQW